MCYNYDNKNESGIYAADARGRLKGAATMWEEISHRLAPPDDAAMAKAKARLDSLAKLPGSLGELENAVIRLAGFQRTDRPSIGRKTAVVFCADNGVVAEGVTPSAQRITAAQAANFARGGGVVNAFARRAGAGVLVVDVGIACEYDEPRIQQKVIRRGTGSIARGPAMTREECLRGIEAGILTAAELAENGTELAIAGEMGIGNTTTASAVSAVLLGCPPEEVTGRGAGGSGGVSHKVAVVRRALEINRPDSGDPIDILSKVGGLDIAAMCGLYLGGAAYGVAVMVDGMISSAAALCAVRLAPLCASALFASHCTAEKAGPRLLEALGLRPLITAGLCLGEGTGGLLGAGLLDSALAAYYETAALADL